MSDSPRMAWVMNHAAQLIEIAANCGASNISLCGSVARGTDSENSDIDFYVRDFEEGEPGSLESLEASERAEALVAAFRELCPFNLDVCGIPGWLLAEGHRRAMLEDSILLSDLL